MPSEMPSNRFNEISSIIKKDVIRKGRCYLLVYLHELYTDSLERVFEKTFCKNGHYLYSTASRKHTIESIFERH